MAKFVIILCLVGFALASPLSQEGRIIGGVAAPQGAYPHQVSLRQGNWHFCGGSVISQYWVLTAAHCTYQVNPASVQAVVGTNYLKSGGKYHNAAQIIVHEGYNPNGHSKDISLIQIYGSFVFTAHVRPIPLTSFSLPSGYVCILSGWGSISYPNQVAPNALQHIQLNSLSLDKCKQRLPGYPVYDFHVCTYSNPGQGACHGDSGGPLICGNEQFGIVSWGIPCAIGYPDVFTSVAYFRGWIQQIIGV